MSQVPEHGIAAWVGKKKGDPAPIMYLSGSPTDKRWDENKFQKLVPWPYRCVSFFYLDKPDLKAALDDYFVRGYRIFLDSGAFSFHKSVEALGRGGNKALFKGATGGDRLKNIESAAQKMIRRYVRFVKAEKARGHVYDFYATFDYLRNCAAIFRVTDQLFQLGIQPVPVYHGDQTIDWFQRYIDKGHRLVAIALGPDKKQRQIRIRFLDAVFNVAAKHNVSLHGLAVTSMWGMFRWPWVSVDSASCMKNAVYGKIFFLDHDRRRQTDIHVSHKYATSVAFGSFDALQKIVKEQIIETVKADGFDFEELRRDSYYRLAFNVKQFAKACQDPDLRRYDQWQSVL